MSLLFQIPIQSRTKANKSFYELRESKENFRQSTNKLFFMAEDSLVNLFIDTKELFWHDAIF